MQLLFCFAKKEIKLSVLKAHRLQNFIIFMIADARKRIPKRRGNRNLYFQSTGQVIEKTLFIPLSKSRQNLQKQNYPKDLEKYQLSDLKDI